MDTALAGASQLVVSTSAATTKAQTQYAKNLQSQWTVTTPSGHLPMVSHPDDVHRAIIEFVDHPEMPRATGR